MGVTGGCMTELDQDKPGTLSVRHERIPGYRTEFITGASTGGPLSDDTLRMTLFRDAIPPLVEVFATAPDDPEAADMSKPHPVKVKLFREDVITLILTPEVAEKMGRDLVNVAEAAKAARTG